MNHGCDKHFNLTIFDDVDMMIQAQDVTWPHVAYRIAYLRVCFLKQLV